ncbi:MAG: zinc-binding dehydrogenase [Candidatus Promineifilaceae bacterium]|nr:zinc-binding dehydrogenase [Candidatus Promineifilaceae bacterium]
MRQIWITKAGDPEVLQVKESPEPIPRNGELRIKVEAAGVNPADILGRAGRYSAAPPVPYVAGFEVSGVVDMVTQGVTGFKEGDKVLAYTDFGGHSDTVCVPYLQTFKRLDWMSAQDGAALLVDYLSAYITLVVMGSLHLGDNVLIHNVMDGIGIAGLEICRLVGAKIFGIAPLDKHDLLRQRGLDFPIDTREHDYERVIRETTDGRGVDIVLNRFIGSDMKKDYRVLAPTGRLIYMDTAIIDDLSRSSWTQFLQPITTASKISVIELARDSKSIAGFNLANLWSHGEIIQDWMKQIISWYDEALFRPVIDKTFSFDQAADAHRYAQSQENIGKILLLP